MLAVTASSNDNEPLFGNNSPIIVAPPLPILAQGDDAHQQAINNPSHNIYLKEPTEKKEYSLAELASVAKNEWNLNWDNELLNYLRRYSSELCSKTKHLEDHLSELVETSRNTEVRLSNAFNQFLMLSNTQFIENRVYDDEEDEEEGKDGETKEQEQTSQLEETKTPDEKATDKSVVPKYREALDMGMQAMKLFAIIDDESENENENEHGFDFGAALDIYNDRPLPFIIGSNEFLEDDTLGLGAAPGASDGESDDDGESFDGSHTDSDATGSSFDSKSEEEEEEEEEEDDDDDTESDEGSEKDHEKSNSSASFSDSEKEEEEKLKSSKPRFQPPIPATKPPSEESSGSWSNEEDDDEDKSQKSEENEETRAPPPLPSKDEPSSLFGSAQKETTQSGVLWNDEDDDDEEDLFSYRPSSQNEIMKKQKSVNELFGNDIEVASNIPISSRNLFSAENIGSGLFNKIEINDKEEDPEKDALFDSGSDKGSVVSSLFGTSKKHESDESVSIVSNVPILSHRPSAAILSHESSGSEEDEAKLFHDDGNNDLFGHADKVETSQKVEAPASSFADNPILDRAIMFAGNDTKTKNGIFGESDEESDEDSGFFEEKISKPSQSLPQNEQEWTSKGSKDENDLSHDEMMKSTKSRLEGIFGNSSLKTENEKSIPTASHASSRNLFSDNETDDDGDLFGGKIRNAKDPFVKSTISSKVKSTRGLFSDDEDDNSSNGLFGSSPNILKESKSFLVKDEIPSSTFNSGEGLFGHSDSSSKEKSFNDTQKGITLNSEIKKEEEDDDWDDDEEEKDSRTKNETAFGLFGSSKVADDPVASTRSLFGSSKVADDPVASTKNLFGSSKVTDDPVASTRSLFGGASSEAIRPKNVTEDDWSDDEKELEKKPTSFSLFDTSSTPTSPQNTKTNNSLFGDDIMIRRSEESKKNDNLFGSKEEINRATSSLFPPPMASIRPPASSHGDSDSDEWEDDSLFGKSSAPKT